MERYMYKDESFEGMLKEKADEYRMYPSQQSWENIQKRLQHQNRLINLKSIGLSALLLIGFSVSLSDDQTTNKKTDFAGFTTSSVEQNTIASSVSTLQKTAKIIPITAAVPSIIKATERQEQSENLNNAVAEKTILPDTDPPAISTANETPALAGVEATDQILEKATITTDQHSLKPSLYIIAPNQTEQQTEVLQTKQEQVPVSETVLSDAELNYEVNVPVVSKQKDKKQVQFYLTSAASYRVLYNDNKLTFGNLPQQDPENVARHTPSVGLEMGTAMLFPVSKKIKFRTGIQFNYTRYNVEVFRSAPQLVTVVLNNNYSVSQRVTNLSSNNTGLLKSAEVANETYQFAIPIGFEFKLAGKQKVQWNLATNIQPTYLISASGYLLTQNLEKYIKAPDLLSNLNLNTALETFIRWDIKSLQMQAGPQLRYQVFSNSREGYPIKEHLVDYGFRIGIVKTLK